MPDLAIDPRTAHAYAEAVRRFQGRPQLGLPANVGAPAEMVLKTLGATESVLWISWALEIRKKVSLGWLVALSGSRLIGASAEATPQVWAARADAWSTTTLDGEVLLHFPRGASLRIPGSEDVHALFQPTATRDVEPQAEPARHDPQHGLSGSGDELPAVSDGDHGADRVHDDIGRAAVVSTWQEAEALAAWHMKQLGFEDALVTPAGPDGGIDVTASAAAGQVKHYASPIGAPVVQQLRGAALGKDWALVYSRSGFTRSAAQFADEAKVGLFSYNDSGTVMPVSDAAIYLAEKAGLAEPPSIDSFTLERETKAVMQELMDTAVSIFTKVGLEALSRAEPGSRLYHSSVAELERVKAIVVDLGSRSVPSHEFVERVEEINAATRRLVSDLDH